MYQKMYDPSALYIYEENRKIRPTAINGATTNALDFTQNCSYKKNESRWR